MQVSREELTRSFRELSDEELLERVRAGMRIHVPRGQAAQAQELIASWERGEISISDDRE
jgi:hypothetical protein